ncbi:MAG: D-3-phosphoglycerate dehydrogenase / 2-oxoglutarate reductase, partial [Abditibacteriota bacterium]|nr:D-3-phosphoglycerate dehydrogenase / 2-oxoglutarate reductase [Abditibacteriota bacterium]
LTVLLPDSDATTVPVERSFPHLKYFGPEEFSKFGYSLGYVAAEATYLVMNRLVMNRTVFIPQDIHPTAKEFLHERDYRTYLGAGIDEDSLCTQAVPCHAILLRTANVSRRVMQAAPHLKVIAKHGVGVDNIDLEAATELGIWVTNAPLSNAETVAEHTIGMMIALSRHMLRHDRELRRGHYEIRNQLTGFDLSGKTLGIIGLGRIGSRVAKKAALGLDMKVIAYSPTTRDVNEWIELVPERDEVLRRADFLSLHLPSRPSTQRFIGREELERMKPTAYLLNAARGDVVDEKALIEALQNNRIAGAGLDVFEQEPPLRDNPLFALDNVIVTPHSAALTVEAMKRMALHAAMGIDEVLRGQRPSWPINEPLNPREDH